MKEGKERTHDTIVPLKGNITVRRARLPADALEDTHNAFLSAIQLASITTVGELRLLSPWSWISIGPLFHRPLQVHTVHCVAWSCCSLLPLRLGLTFLPSFSTLTHQLFRHSLAFSSVYPFTHTVLLTAQTFATTLAPCYPAPFAHSTFFFFTQSKQYVLTSKRVRTLLIRQQKQTTLTSPSSTPFLHQAHSSVVRMDREEVQHTLLSCFSAYSFPALPHLPSEIPQGVLLKSLPCWLTCFIVLPRRRGIGY